MKKVFFPSFWVILTGLFFSCLSFGPSQPAISKAAEIGDVEKVQKLLDGGADINTRYDGRTPLERAAMHGKVEVVEYLLTKGAQNPVKAFEETMSKNHYDVAKLMVNSGYVDVNTNGNLFYSIKTYQ
jgi:ankyrin repeat protein